MRRSPSASASTRVCATYSAAATRLMVLVYSIAKSATAAAISASGFDSPRPLPRRVVALVALAAVFGIDGFSAVAVTAASRTHCDKTLWPHR